mgnify:FL=1
MLGFFYSSRKARGGLEASMTRREESQTGGVMAITLRIWHDVTTQSDEAYKSPRLVERSHLLIPNTEVKLFKAKSTWGAGPWEDR